MNEILLFWTIVVGAALWTLGAMMALVARIWPLWYALWTIPMALIAATLGCPGTLTVGVVTALVAVFVYEATTKRPRSEDE